MGQIADETLNHVRFGSVGNDLYESVSIYGRKNCSLMLGATLAVMDTYLEVWRNDGPAPRFTTRSHNLIVSPSAHWSAITANARYYPTRALSLGAGVGYQTIAGQYAWWGAGPMHAPTLHMDAAWRYDLAPTLSVGIKAAGYPTRVCATCWNVIKIMGVSDGGLEWFRAFPDDFKLKNRWILPLSAGATFELKL